MGIELTPSNSYNEYTEQYKQNLQKFGDHMTEQLATKQELELLRFKTLNTCSSKGCNKLGCVVVYPDKITDKNVNENLKRYCVLHADYLPIDANWKLLFSVGNRLRTKGLTLRETASLLGFKLNRQRDGSCVATSSRREMYLRTVRNHAKEIWSYFRSERLIT